MARPNVQRLAGRGKALVSRLSRPLVRALDRLSFVIFGQRAPEIRAVGWIPGNGGHGGDGGQAPPWVPYNPDWDPENRIR